MRVSCVFSKNIQTFGMVLKLPKVQSLREIEQSGIEKSNFALNLISKKFDVDIKKVQTFSWVFKDREILLFKKPVKKAQNAFKEFGLAKFFGLKIQNRFMVSASESSPSKKLNLLGLFKKKKFLSNPIKIDTGSDEISYEIVDTTRYATGEWKKLSRRELTRMQKQQDACGL